VLDQQKRFLVCHNCQDDRGMTACGFEQCNCRSCCDVTSCGKCGTWYAPGCEMGHMWVSSILITFKGSVVDAAQLLAPYVLLMALA
jgi:hypothetical protein